MSIKLVMQRKKNPVVDKSSLKNRKLKISRTMEDFLVGTKMKHRAELAEHICETGIELLGEVCGVDVTNAIVITPEDSTARLLYAMSRHSDRMHVDHDDLCDALIEFLEKPHMLAN